MNPFLLKAERKQQGWSQAQVAETLGISARTLRRWEQGASQKGEREDKKVPSLAKCQKEKKKELSDVQ